MCDTSVTTDRTSIILIPFADISSRKREKAITGMHHFQPKVVETQCILSWTAIKMINCLRGPGELGKSTKMFWKKLSSTNSDMLYYNFPASHTVLTSTEEFLQSQTCYCNSSSNCNFSHTFKINIRRQSLLHSPLHSSMYSPLYVFDSIKYIASLFKLKHVGQAKMFCTHPTWKASCPC